MRLLAILNKRRQMVLHALADQLRRGIPREMVWRITAQGLNPPPVLDEAPAPRTVMTRTPPGGLLCDQFGEEKVVDIAHVLAVREIRKRTGEREPVETLSATHSLKSQLVPMPNSQGQRPRGAHRIVFVGEVSAVVNGDRGNEVEERLDG